MDKLLLKIKKYKITYIIILVCILLYLYSYLLFGNEMNVEEAIEFGAYNGMLVYYYNDYYRLLLSNFIHFGFLHLFVNCYSLNSIGCFIEGVFEKYEYSIILLCSALSTTGISYVLYLIFEFEENVLSAGASGIIFGMVGSLLALSIVYKNIFMNIFKSLIPNLVLMLLLSIFIPQISLSGHLFGMFGGFISTLVILLVKKRKYKIIN